MELVKRYGTLDRVSGGRLILGVGVGSLKEEFDLIGAEFEDRGPRGDDAIRALKASFGKEMPEYHGEYYDYDGFVVEPRSIQTDLPIWIGGRTYRSLRRAVELGDGWVPFGLPVKDMAAMLARARATDEWATRTTPLEIALQSSILDPIGDPDGTRAGSTTCRRSAPRSSRPASRTTHSRSTSTSSRRWPRSQSLRSRSRPVDPPVGR